MGQSIKRLLPFRAKEAHNDQLIKIFLLSSSCLSGLLPSRQPRVRAAGFAGSSQLAASQQVIGLLS